MLKRLWPKVKPSVVVLIFCSQNDRLDNSSNIRYEDYQKPYFATQPDGSLKLMNTPVPRSHILYIVEDWLVRNLWLARMATNAYVRLRYPRLAVPDPSEKIVGSIRDFVVANGGKFMVGIQYHDEALTRYLEVNKIPFVQLGGADFYTQGGWGPHWTRTAEESSDVLLRQHDRMIRDMTGRAGSCTEGMPSCCAAKSLPVWSPRPSPFRWRWRLACLPLSRWATSILPMARWRG